MGTRSRQKPERLAEKLLQVRLTFGLSQTEMLRRLDAEDLILYNRISEYELGKREPPLPILLRYARVAGVPMEALVDDELDLPEHLPGPTDHQEIRRQFASRRRRK
ncbi:MAG TPA: helix-turn-helix transcriptional regulator [Pyrinomonadaceae bacterium]|nr:helix-turn-helix transcriptional regulator [Pyrinomonadaceae bacterium]